MDKPHIAEKSLVKQVGTRLNAVFKTRKMLADGLFMSKLVYLIPLWGGCEKFLIKALQIIQNKAARSVTKLGIFTPVQLLLKQCGWLHQLVFFHTLVLLFKTNQQKTPQYLFDMTSSDLNYKTRAENPGKLRSVADYIPEQGLNRKSYKWRSTMYWNQLPPDIRLMDNLGKFKVKLKSWVLLNIDINP